MITLRGINKSFKLLKREKGASAALKALFSREYTELKALSDVSFHIEEGEIVGYIGPNGAGKSTTIKVMSGILTPDSGECEIMGYTPWKSRREYVRDIGVVFGQRTQLWWDVPIIDSFELLREIYKVPKPAYDQNLEMLVETMALQDFIKTPLRQLSLGQRMRAEIAASLLHGPRILFLDEPTIGLDAVSKLAVRQFIKAINREKKLTVLLTTHDQSDIEALTDRVILIGKGQILHDGSMQAIHRSFDRYRRLTLAFAPKERPVEIEGAKLISWSGEGAVYELEPSKVSVSAVVAQLSREINILDMTSEGPPLEEVIAGLYKEHGL
ncbi:MAG: ATP-binding cassette domain-containing protein [Christensenellaceae bacterium]|jgi:ABC-2 type transport system ATP-binding protein|nr:ATP-binding cassette domain-containing protein [Christensenellaceae bacterium]